MERTPREPAPGHAAAAGTAPRTPATLRRWRRHLADERAEEATYRDLARRREGEEREILVALADAEARHAAHWTDLLGDDLGRPARTDLRTRVLGLLARRFGSIFVLALVQSAETRSRYAADVDATDAMAADERIHAEVVRGLAARGRNRLSGTFRAAVFGANDGLVSNLALVIGVSAAGAAPSIVLLTGLSGLLAGALSMGAGEYVSVRSQRELLDASSLRDALARLAVAAADGHAPDADAVDTLNLFAALPDVPPALPGGRRRAGAARLRTAQALASVARDGVATFTASGFDADDGSRLRRCQNGACGLVFVDDSRAGSRRWCSMQRCGNRAKVRAWRAKQTG